LVSPKTFHQRCSEWEFKLKKEREDTMNKYKEAEKALLLVAELQNEEQNNSNIEQENIENKSNKKSLEASPVLTHKRSNPSSEHSTPEKKTINLFINVDEID
jgi:hypothetical protein